MTTEVVRYVSVVVVGDTVTEMDVLTEVSVA